MIKIKDKFTTVVRLPFKYKKDLSADEFKTLLFQYVNDQIKHYKDVSELNLKTFESDLVAPGDQIRTLVKGEWTLENPYVTITVVDDDDRELVAHLHKLKDEKYTECNIWKEELKANQIWAYHPKLAQTNGAACNFCFPLEESDLYKGN